jgi:hypothetical protein
VALAVQRQKSWAWLASLVIGLALVGWIVVQIILIGFQPSPPLQTTYGLVGLAIAGVAVIPLRHSYDWQAMKISVPHLAWLPITAAAGFGVSFVFADLLTLPLDLYYLIYIAFVAALAILYLRITRMDLWAWVSRRLAWGIVAGVLGGLVLMQVVLARPATPAFSGAMLWWAILWRGVAYGTADGVLLLALPWIIVWRALGARDGGWQRKLAAAMVAWVAIIVTTTSYHLGYSDFRSEKIVQPNIGSTIAALPTLLIGNPVASPISHVFLHVAAIVHVPQTELFLPPHRD